MRRNRLEFIMGIRRAQLRLLKLANVLLMTVPFACAWFWGYSDRIASPYFFRGNFAVIGLFCLLYLGYGLTYDAFIVSYKKRSELVGSQVLAALVANFFMFIVVWLLIKHLPKASPLFFAFIVQVSIATSWVFFAQKWYFKTFKPKNTIVVCDDARKINELKNDYDLEKKFKIVKVVSTSDCLADMDVLRRVKVVFLVDIETFLRHSVIKYCVDHRISVFLVPGIGDVLLGGARQMHLFHLPLLRLNRYQQKIESVVCKRIVDICLASFLLVLFAPLLLVAAFCIRLDGGPVFYRQHRLTQNGKQFDMIKLRSMRVDAEKDGVARLSTGVQDDRVTRVGRIIRKFRIDELPQLFNVLAGDMAMVGPRPERPEIATEYEAKIPEFKLRLQVKAGVTGYAQVYGKYNTSPQDKLKMDLMYIASASPLQDLAILFATVKVLFVPESTDGIEAYSTNALRKSAGEDSSEDD